jgi:hypothetical protein
MIGTRSTSILQRTDQGLLLTMNHFKKKLLVPLYKKRFNQISVMPGHGKKDDDRKGPAERFFATPSNPDRRTL